MKITRRQLRQIISEQADSFTGRSTISIGIGDAIIGHLENEGFFDPGEIPQSVINVINNSALLVTDAMKGKRADTNGNGSLDPDELRATDDIDDVGPSTSQMPASWQQILGNTLGRK